MIIIEEDVSDMLIFEKERVYVSLKEYYEHRCLWGKSEPYHPLICHMIDTGNIANALISDGSVFSGIKKIFAEQLSLKEESIPETVSFLVAVHDIGKCHPLFQKKADKLTIVSSLKEQRLLMKGVSGDGYRHEIFSGEWLNEYLSKKHPIRKDIADFFGDVVSLHHQKHLNKLDLKDYEISGTIDLWWREQREKLLADLEKLYSIGVLEINEIKHMDKVGILFTGLLILSDWIASNTEFFPGIGSIPYVLEEYFEASLKKAKRAVGALGFQGTGPIAIGHEFHDVWISLKNYQPRPLQRACEELAIEGKLSPGLTILEAPMGEGKTEAAVYIAMQWMLSADKKGIYFALPTATTSNQMYKRINKFIHMHDIHENVKLLHAMAWIVQEETASWANMSEAEDEDLTKVAQRWFAPSRVGLLKAWAVGTVDQAMSAALQIRFGVLRWLGMSQKILIIDEVHAYDIFMETIIERLLAWCRALEVPVILLSATLPTQRRKELMKAYGAKAEYGDCDDYPAISHVAMDGKCWLYPVYGNYADKPVVIKKAALLGKWAKVAQLAVERVEKEGGCLCVVVNTVGDAQMLYEEIIKAVSERNLEKNVETLLFHARFTLEDRDRIEKRCLELFDKRSISENRQPAILVATQVVEQSLDLDFDWMISSIAPIDLLLQRMGRLHRHEGRKRPAHCTEAEFVVLVPEKEWDYGADGKVYMRWLLWVTETHLPGRLIIPKDIRGIVERVYTAPKPDEESMEKEFWDEMEHRRSKSSSEAKQYLLGSPSDDEFTLTYIPKLNEDEETDELTKAKTRAGDDSVMLVLVDEQRYGGLQAMKHWDNQLSKELLKNSVSVPVWKKPSGDPEKGFKKCSRGKGKLSHALMVPMKDNFYRWNIKSKNKGNQPWFMKNDRRLGIVIRRETDE
ncbi:MAG: CRISPR-associated helicase Cas3' [Bacillota bacterium]|nr:CRISPR-associated helicase Cas3' [Bacillota bacterium]